MSTIYLVVHSKERDENDRPVVLEEVTYRKEIPIQAALHLYRGVKSILDALTFGAKEELAI